MPHATALRSLARRTVSTLTLVVPVLALAAAFVARAEDTRPKEIPFETPTEIPQLDPTYRAGNHKVVLITDQALNPRLVKLKGDEVVAWLSYSSQPTAIVFEREVAKNMTCHHLVNFKLEEDELRSALMHAGDFASFCELKPGRYTYNVVRPDPGQNTRSAAPKLGGEIIVEGGSTTTGGKASGGQNP